MGLLVCSSGALDRAARCCVISLQITAVIHGETQKETHYTCRDACQNLISTAAIRFAIAAVCYQYHMSIGFRSLISPVCSSVYQPRKRAQISDRLDYLLESSSSQALVHCTGKYYVKIYAIVILLLGLWAPKINTTGAHFSQESPYNVAMWAHPSIDL